MHSKVCKCLLRLVKRKMIKVLLRVILFVFICVVLFRARDYSSDVKLSYSPVIVWWTEGFPGTSEIRQCPNNIKCEVYSNRNVSKLYNVQAYLFYGSNINFNSLPLPRKPKDLIWGLYHEESPRNVEEFMHEPILRLFNYSSTYSRYSDVPFPLQHLDSFEDITSTKYFVETSQKNLQLKDIAPILYLQSDCETSTERDAYVKELMKIAQVDSYGLCLNNKQLPEKFTQDYLNNLNEDEFLRFVARYKFVVAIENGVCNDYITEKFWRAIKVGTVPIYFGSSTIRDWLPNEKSAILIEDYPTPNALNDHINLLLENDGLYEEYLEHKTKQIATNSKLIEEFRNRPHQIDALKTAEVFECFVCKKIHDHMNGFTEASIVSKSHYDCPKPISALSQAVNPKNSWVLDWEYKKEKAEHLYNSIMGII